MYKVNIFEMNKQWWEFTLSNPDKVRPIHTAIYFRAIEQCNILGWKEKFGLPTYMTMQYIGISSHKSYFKAFNELIKWGFIKLIKKSVNHHNANIVSLVFLTLLDTSLSNKVDTSLDTLLGDIKVPYLGHYNKTINTNKTNKTNKEEILKMTGKSVEEVLQSDFSIEDKHKILTIRMMRISNYNLNDKEKYKSCLNTVKKRYLNTNLL
jgi:hypothetical protein